jgi:two-component system chemotaxis response regulator CheB
MHVADPPPPLRAKRIAPILSGEAAMPARDIVVIGASNGGLDPLRAIVSQLPPEFPASLFVVLHTTADGQGLLAALLDRHGGLPARLAENGEEIRRGRIYVAPSDRHLLIEKSRVYTTHGPRENRARPAIDPMFRTAAAAHGSSVIGVILSGSLDDGATGLAAIKRCGGTAVVQDPDDAFDAEMPRSAVESTEVDHVLPAAAIGDRLQKLVGSAPTEVEPAETAAARQEITSGEKHDIDQLQKSGRLVPVACPECGGALWETPIEGLPRIRCHTGHGFSHRSLAIGLSHEAEQSLWSALRLMEERARMLRRMASEQESKGRTWGAGSFTSSAEEAERHAEEIHKLLRSM